MFSNYPHVVSVVSRDGKRFVRIDRLIGEKKDFYTEIEISQNETDDRWDAFDKLAETIGKSICIDSPLIREQLGIDRD